MEKMYTIVSMILFLFMESGVFCSTFGIISPISPQGNFNIWIWTSRIVAPPIHLMSHLYAIHLGHLCVISSFISQPVFFVEQLASLNKMKDILKTITKLRKKLLFFFQTSHFQNKLFLYQIFVGFVNCSHLINLWNVTVTVRTFQIMRQHLPNQVH